MALSRRFPVLVLAGVFAVLAAPSAATAWAWVGLCVVVAGVFGGITAKTSIAWRHECSATRAVS